MGRYVLLGVKSTPLHTDFQIQRLFTERTGYCPLGEAVHGVDIRHVYLSLSWCDIILVTELKP
jgi:hypothetical protein